MVRFVNKGWYVLNIVSNPAHNSIFIFCSFQVLGSIQVFMICLYFCYKLKNWISPEFGKVTCIEREFLVNIEFIELFNITVNFVISNQKGKATLENRIIVLCYMAIVLSKHFLALLSTKIKLLPTKKIRESDKGQTVLTCASSLVYIMVL